MTPPKRTGRTLTALALVAGATAPAWHYLWDLQHHELRIALGIYAVTLAGALVTSFDVYVHTRDGGPNYEPMWLVAWPLWSLVSVAFIALFIAGPAAIVVLAVAALPIALLSVAYVGLSKRLRTRSLNTLTHDSL